VYGQVVTLWDPFTVTLRHTLLHPPPIEHIRWARFVPASPYLVCASTHTLYVWNLLTVSVWWSYALPVCGLAVDGINTSTQHFAVAISGPAASSAASGAALGSPQMAGRSVSSAADSAAADAKGEGRGSGGGGAGAPSVSHLLLFRAESPIPVRVWSVPDLHIEYAADSVHPSIAYASSRAYRLTPIAFVVCAAHSLAHSHACAVLALSADQLTGRSAVRPSSPLLPL
jgi:hypothetical protein